MAEATKNKSGENKTFFLLNPYLVLARYSNVFHEKIVFVQFFLNMKRFTNIFSNKRSGPKAGIFDRGIKDASGHCLSRLGIEKNV